MRLFFDLIKANKKEKCFTKQIEIVHDFIKQNGYIVKCNEDNEDEFYPYLKTIFIKFYLIQLGP